MMLDSTNYPPLPNLQPSTLHSFYPYPVSSRSSVHCSIRGLPPPSSSSNSNPGPGPSTEAIKRETRAEDRAARRALMGKRPAGVALGREAEELSDEEADVENEKDNINLFGHRFLLPFGRRLTQMEMDAAPSPTPSEADQERRQEDRNIASPVSPMNVPQEGETEEGQEVDLDGSVEDLDASMEGEEEDEGDEEGEEEDDGMEEE